MSWNPEVDRARWTPLVRRLTLVWALFVVAGSLQPRRPATMLALHREIHWLAFAGLAFLVLLVSRALRQAIPRVFSVLLLGVSLETFQHFVYHTATEWRDVRDDGLAILAVCAIYWLAVRSRPLAPGRS